MRLTRSIALSRLKIVSMMMTVFIPLGARAGTAYSVSWLPLPSPAGPADAYTAINNAGEAVGTSSATGTFQAVVGTAGGFTVLPIPGAGNNEAFGAAINDSGVVAGTACNTSVGGMCEAFIGSTPLGLDGSMSVAAVLGLNDTEQAVGLTVNGTAFIATTSGYQNLPDPESQFLGINSAGIAIGGDGQYTVYGTAAGVTRIPLIPGWTGMTGYGINDAGHVCGVAVNASNQHADFYFDGTIATVIPDLGLSQENCINDKDQIMGTNENGGVIWDPVNGIQVLNNFVPAGWNIENTWAINNAGEILAYAAYGTSEGYVVLDPTPEPTSVVLVMTGLAALGITRGCQEIKT